MPTGEHEITRAGTIRQITKFTCLCQTPVGEFTMDEWRNKALEAIAADGKMELLEKIKRYCGENHAWLKKEKDIEEYAIECLCSGAYRHWAVFAE